MQATPNTSILALDVGNARIGVAIASTIARLSHPLTALPNDTAFVTNLRQLIQQEAVTIIVVGLPRGLNGQETEQTKTVTQFVTELRKFIDIPFHFQDEALTSAKAETELKAHGKLYSKGDVDALAATYILEDYLQSI